MLFHSPFSNANFNSLKAGDFFFHALTDEYTPAIKVVCTDGAVAVVDLNYAHQNGRHLPTLVGLDNYQNLTVVAVETAVIRPKPGLATMKHGAAATIDRAALVLAPSQTFLKVRGYDLAIFAFDVTTGHQGTLPDSPQCLWTAEWQIAIRENDKDIVLFERKA